MRVDILTIFPDMFEPTMSASMLGIAREKGLLEVHYHDLRTWTRDMHRTVDDAPYGGGSGMVLKCEPLFAAIEAIQAMDVRRAHTIFLAPFGTPYKQSIAHALSDRQRILFVCGRYEGIDERAYSLADEVISLGDYVLTGGELAAMVIIDSVTRLIPGVLGDDMSSIDESFSTNLLEYPHYTRPALFEGMSVPDVLLSGNHKAIDEWRCTQSFERTKKYRPDLLEKE